MVSIYVKRRMEGKRLTVIVADFDLRELPEALLLHEVERVLHVPLKVVLAVVELDLRAPHLLPILLAAEEDVDIGISLFQRGMRVKVDIKRKMRHFRLLGDSPLLHECQKSLSSPYNR